MQLNNLQEGKTYTITFDVNTSLFKQTIKCIKVLIKLENSIKILDIDTNVSQWYRTNVFCEILDEIPEKYFRKEKLKKLEEIDNE